MTFRATGPTWAQLRDGLVDVSQLEMERGWLGRQPGRDPQGPSVPADRRPPVTTGDFLHGITKGESE